MTTHPGAPPSLVLSTSLMPLPQTPEALVAGLQHYAGDHANASTEISGWSLDSRLTALEQAALLDALKRSGRPVMALAHPARGRHGRPAAVPHGADPDERREARRQLMGSVERASAHEVPVVMVPPAPMPLRESPAVVQDRYARGGELGMEGLWAERRARGDQALDGMCSVLDAVLEAGLRHGVMLLLTAPVPWPHLAPSMEEVVTLAQTFAGAPLGVCAGADLAHLVGPLEAPGWPLPDPLAALTRWVRLADACGLTTRLPLGTGEVDWDDPDALPPQGAEAVVLVHRPDSTQAEVAASASMASRLISTMMAPEAQGDGAQDAQDVTTG